MRQLIEDNISLASTQRTVPVIVEANGQYSADQEWTLYFAAQRLKDDCWRYQSPSRIARLYSDLGWKGSSAELHLVASQADNLLGVIEQFWSRPTASSQSSFFGSGRAPRGRSAAGPQASGTSIASNQ
jgi:hypothetical protein